MYAPQHVKMAGVMCECISIVNAMGLICELGRSVRFTTLVPLGYEVSRQLSRSPTGKVQH